MLTLTEYVQVDRWSNTIDESTVNESDGYTIGYDHKNQQTVIRLYNESEKLIGEGRFDSAELAMAVLEEYFDVSEDDKQWNESYEWVEDSKKALDESLESIEDFITRNATEYQIRIDDIDPDAMFDGSFGIEVFFNSKNNRNDLSAFVKEVSGDLLSTYGAQSYDFDGSSWKIAL